MRPQLLAFPTRCPLLFLATVFAFVSLACSGDDPAATSPGTDALQADAQEQRLTTQAAPANHGHYPLDPGWQWTYQRTFRVYTEQGDLWFESTATSTVWTMGEVDLGAMTAQGLAVHTVEDPMGDATVYRDEVYYVQDRNTLTEVAYRSDISGIIVTPKPTPGEGRSPRYRLGSRTFDSLAEIPRTLDLLARGWTLPAGPSSTSPAESGDIIFRDDPRLALVYPLRPGQAWVSFEDPFLQTREVVKRGAIALPAGNFGGAEILSVLPEFETEFTDWVSQPGLVARDIQAEVVVVDEEGNPTGETLYAVDHTDLESFQRPHGPRPDARRP